MFILKAVVSIPIMACVAALFLTYKAWDLAINALYWMGEALCWVADWCWT